MAMMPPARGLLNADNSVFLTTPRLLPMTMNLSSSNSFSVTSAAIRSPSSIDTRLAIAVPLIAVVRDGGALHITGVADRDRHFLVGNQIFDLELAFFGEDLRPALVAVLLLHPPQFVDDDLHHQLVAGQDGEEAFDQLQQV